MYATRWPDGLPVAQVRIARPTDRLDDVVSFYRDGLGLPVLTSFTDHAGFDGVMIGLPGLDYHLEFTHHRAGSPGDAPSPDNLLVLYVPDETSIRTRTNRLQSMGYTTVPSENPYWDDNGAVTIEDPDGWRVVLMPTSGIQGRYGRANQDCG